MFNNLLADKWLNRWGVMGSLRRYLLLLGAGCVTIAIANRIEVVWLGIAMLGASFGGLAVAQNLLVIHGSSPQRRTQAISGLHLMYGVASLLAPIAVSISYLFELKWNSAFYIAALVPFGVFLWSLREKSSPRLNLEHNEDSGEPLSLKPLIWVAVFTSSYVVTEILVSSRIVQYVRAFQNYTPTQANDLLAGFFIALLGGRLILTVVKVRVKNSTLLKTSMSLSAVAMLLAIYVEPLWFVVVGLTMSVSFPCMIAFASETFGAHTARVMAWIFTGNYIGLIVMQTVVGAVSDTLGLRQALLLGPLFLAFGVMLLMLPPTLPRSETSHSLR